MEQEEHPPTSREPRRVLGVFLILVGFLALITPFTPGSWLIFVGLELIGIRLAFWQQLRKRWAHRPGDPDENPSHGEAPGPP